MVLQKKKKYSQSELAVSFPPGALEAGSAADCYHVRSRQGTLLCSDSDEIYCSVHSQDESLSFLFLSVCRPFKFYTLGYCGKKKENTTEEEIKQDLIKLVHLRIVGVGTFSIVLTSKAPLPAGLFKT